MTFGLPLSVDPPVVKLGDKMRVNVELMQGYRDRPDQESQLVIVDRIDRLPDGTVTMWLKDADREAARASEGSD